MLQDKVEKTDKIYLVLLCIIIALLHLFVGSSHQEPKIIFETIIIIVGLTYILIKKIQNKENIIIKGKIDILMLLMIIAMLIPLIIKTYYSLNDTINFFIDFMCVYVIYILARNVIKTKKELNLVIDVTLVSSIIIVIFGLDELYYNVFLKFLDFINSAKSNAYGMVSTIGYSNPVAVYMTFLSFLALGRYLCVKNSWIKSLYFSYIQIAMIGFVFGNSRALMVIFPIVFIIYLIVLKDNKNILQSILVMGLNIVIAYIFQAVCNKLVTNNFTLWLAFSVTIIIIYFMSLLINNIIKKINVKINKKKFLIAFISIILLVIVYCVSVKNISKPIDVKESKHIMELLGLKNNYDYNIKFEINAEIQEDTETEEGNDSVKNEKDDMIYDSIKDTSSTSSKTRLTIVCFNSRREQGRVEEQIILNGEQTLEFNIRTEDDFERIMIYIYNPEYEQNKVTLKHIYINDKEYIASFKYLPYDLVRMIRTINFRTVSVHERLDFYKDALKLASNHLIFGAGGKTYANHIKPYQTYVHGYNSESHSYIIDMLLNYGIFGLLTYIAILVVTIYTGIITIKQKRKIEDNNLPLYVSILFGITTFTLHAFIDFDLVYLLTLSMYYMFIGVLNNEDKNLKIKKIEITDYVMVIVLAIILTITSSRCVANYFAKKGEYKKAYSICNYVENVKYKILNDAHNCGDKYTVEEYLPIYTKDEKYKNNMEIIKMYYFVIYENLIDGIYTKVEKNLEKLYLYITENDNFSKVNESKIEIKNYMIEVLIKDLETYDKALNDEGIKMWYNKFNELL